MSVIKKRAVRTEKTCTKCRVVKLLEEYYKSSHSSDGRQGTCKECQYRYLQERRAANPELFRKYRKDFTKRYPEKNRAINKNSTLKRMYGIDTSQFMTILSRQDGLCAICKTDSSGGQGTWHVDHCHVSSKVRGLLCHHCNVGLGHFKDDVILLGKAITYLTEKNIE